MEGKRFPVQRIADKSALHWKSKERGPSRKLGRSKGEPPEFFSLPWGSLFFSPRFTGYVFLNERDIRSSCTGRYSKNAGLFWQREGSGNFCTRCRHVGSISRLFLGEFSSALLGKTGLLRSRCLGSSRVAFGLRRRLGEYGMRFNRKLKSSLVNFDPVRNSSFKLFSPLRTCLHAKLDGTFCQRNVTRTGRGKGLFRQYRRIPKVTAPVTFGFCRQKGPLLSGSRYFRIGKKRLSLEVVLDKEDTYYEI